MINNIKGLLREELAFEGLVNEIDWDDTFSDVKKSCVNPKEMVDYLNRVRANADKKTKDREKFNSGKPFVHAKSKFFKKEDTEVDIEHFIQKMTAKPNNIINTNDKMLKSGGPHEYVYKTGIPAFRGIAYDISKGEFYFINTCPGAGDCVLICYALKGRYIQYPASYDSMTRRLNYLLNYPDKYQEQMYKELRKKCEEHKAFSGYKSKVVLRWNDSGDFFAEKYTNIAETVMEQLRKEGYNIESYAYTKVADVANNNRAGNSTFSSGANKKQTSQVDKSNNKRSVIIPKPLFKGLDLMKVDDEIELKNRVAKQFKLDNVITYDELRSTPKGDEPKWNVIVTPNDGDDAAFRPDVLTIMLTQH
jgi:hypothetical protein